MDSNIYKQRFGENIYKEFNMEIEEKLNQIVEKFLSNDCNYAWNICDNKKCEELDLRYRKNISEEVSGCRYKYIEYSKIPDGTKICVGIGFNPAEMYAEKLDGTNTKIINALKQKGYGLFILLNLYPLVSSSKAEFDETDKKSIKFKETCLPELLDYIFTQTDMDVLIFWGRTVSIDQEIFEKIKKFCDDQRLYMTVKEGENIHCHPARVSIEIIPVSQNNLKVSYFIK